MNLCSDGHEEVCFDSRKCPVCEEQERIEVLEKRIEDLEDEADADEE